MSSTTSNASKPNSRAMGLFPTLDSEEAVINLGLSQLPIMTPNALVCLLMTYKNTLIKQLKEEQNNEKPA